MFTTDFIHGVGRPEPARRATETVFAEVHYRQKRFLRRTSEGPIRLELR